MMRFVVEDAKLMPTKKYISDAGFDLYSAGNFKLYFGTSVTIPTGVRIEWAQSSNISFGNGLRFGLMCLIKPKSGLAAEGLTIDAGVIDCGYTGEILVLARCWSRTGYVIRKYDPIAQIIPLLVYLPNVVTVEKEDDTRQTDGGIARFYTKGIILPE